jgi:hypothetical protein
MPYEPKASNGTVTLPLPFAIKVLIRIITSCTLQEQEEFGYYLYYVTCLIVLLLLPLSTLDD